MNVNIKEKIQNGGRGKAEEEKMASVSPLSLWALPQSFHPRTSHLPIPNCGMGAGSCPGDDAAAL